MSQRWKCYLQPITPVILLFFTWASIHPWNYASAASHTRTSSRLRVLRRAALPAATPMESNNGTALSKALSQIETILTALRFRLDRDGDVSRETATLGKLRQRLQHLDVRVRQEFARIEQHLKDKRLAEEIRQRHRAMGATYDAEMVLLHRVLATISTARNIDDRRTTTEQALNLLRARQHRPLHESFDPTNLPFRVPESKVRKPYERQEDFWTSILRSQPTKLASATILPGMLVSAQGIPPHAPPTSEDLAPTEDVQLTNAIRDLAASLDHNPVKIYTWVHNHIEFLPTYGSIQGAQMTLDNKAGNAFDTARLLVALLRAADIPARYVLGTVQIPIAKVMNWVGGVNTPGAALQALGQGGIPSTGLVAGGVIKAVKIEHVWVSAWVDFVPSRGYVQREGDTWVPMDASFKQYDYTEGMKLRANVAFDAQTFAQQLVASAQLDETAGWISGLDHGLIETTVSNYQEQIDTFITSQKVDATVGDVLGTKTIIPIQRPVLAGSLPYQQVVRGITFTAIPDNLRHKYQYTLYTSALDRSLDTPVWRFRSSLLKLAGKNITLSFVPATQSDAETIASFFPNPPADQSLLDLSAFPTSLPGYLIRLVAELRLDGEVVARGGSFIMGQELISSEAVFDPIRGWEFAEDNTPVAGEYRVIVINASRITPRQVEDLQQKLTTTRVALEAGDTTGLSQEELLGNLLYGTLVSYFAVNDIAGRIEAGTLGVLTYRQPSFGSFTAVIQPHYWLGVPITVSFVGFEIDIDRLVSLVVDRDNNLDNQIASVWQNGLRLSAYEHRIPELMLAHDHHPGEAAISAVKALSVASRQGQRLYKIKQDNISDVLPQLSIDSQVRDELKQSAALGKEIIISQHPVTIGGWTGVGYIIFDPETGSGAYKISGGANGGLFVAGVDLTIIAIIALVLVALNPVIAAAGVSIVLGLSAGISASLGAILIGSSLAANPDLSYSSIKDELWYSISILGALVSCIFCTVTYGIIAMILMSSSIIDKLEM